MISKSLGSRRAVILRAAMPLIILGSVAGALRRFPPMQYSFYPRCPLYEMFHLQCPGCGATRALAALLQGRIGEAMDFNALVTLLIPIVAALGMRWYLSFVRCEANLWPRIPPAAIYVSLAAASIFTVLRNLPHRLFQ